MTWRQSFTHCSDPGCCSSWKIDKSVFTGVWIMWLHHKAFCNKLSGFHSPTWEESSSGLPCFLFLLQDKRMRQHFQCGTDFGVSSLWKIFWKSSQQLTLWARACSSLAFFIRSCFSLISFSSLLRSYLRLCSTILLAWNVIKMLIFIRIVWKKIWIWFALCLQPSFTYYTALYFQKYSLMHPNQWIQMFQSLLSSQKWPQKILSFCHMCPQLSACWPAKGAHTQPEANPVQ